jgi:hypothetical protein
MTIKEEFEQILKIQEIGNLAVQKAQEENRRLGIPNWYSINGVIVSDQQLAEFAKKSNN